MHPYCTLCGLRDIVAYDECTLDTDHIQYRSCIYLFMLFKRVANLTRLVAKLCDWYFHFLESFMIKTFWNVLSGHVQCPQCFDAFLLQKHQMANISYWKHMLCGLYFSTWPRTKPWSILWDFSFLPRIIFSEDSVYQSLCINSFLHTILYLPASPQKVYTVDHFFLASGCSVACTLHLLHSTFETLFLMNCCLSVQSPFQYNACIRCLVGGENISEHLLGHYGMIFFVFVSSHSFCFCNTIMCSFLFLHLSLLCVNPLCSDATGSLLKILYILI